MCLSHLYHSIGGCSGLLIHLNHNHSDSSGPWCIFVKLHWGYSEAKSSVLSARVFVLSFFLSLPFFFFAFILLMKRVILKQLFQDVHCQDKTLIICWQIIH